MKTFFEHKQQEFNQFDALFESVHSYNESLQDMQVELKSELTEAEEAEIDKALDKFVAEFLEKNRNLEDFESELIDEGLVGSILGGLTGFALGKTVGKVIAKVLGVEKKGILYDLLTSRLVGAAIGSSLGKRL